MKTIIRIPLNEMQKAIYELLSSRGAPVFDNLADLDVFPRIEIGEQNGDADGTKVEYGHKIEMLLHVYSRSEGKKELNDYMNATSALIGSTSPESVELENSFKLLEWGVTYYESFLVEDEDADFAGYHGILKITALIQEFGGAQVSLPWIR